MYSQIIAAERSTSLKKNGPKELIIEISREILNKVFVLNGSSFITEKISKSDLIVNPNDYYMIINRANVRVEIVFSEDVSNHEIIYDPYKYEHSEKQNYKVEDLKNVFEVPEGYVDTLPKWYSFKFTYPKYNLIFIRPELGISIQIHDLRNEYWEIIDGEPIVINGNHVYYLVKTGSKFEIPINTFHSIINPNQDIFVIIKEHWDGTFNEDDISRIYNPNRYGI